jgi:hypothetical protein
VSNVKTTCLRFNLDNSEHAKAWRYLKQLDKNVFKSCNNSVISAVNEYFDRYERTQDDPYFENRQREEKFVEQIVGEVGKSLVAEMPKFLASFMINLNSGYAVKTAPQEHESSDASHENGDYSDIDMDFIGG